MHFSWIYFCLLTSCVLFTKSARNIEIVRGISSDERACDSRLMDTQAKLPDSAFSASSVRHNLPEFRPYRARLASLYAGKEHTSVRVWCPNNTVQTAMNEWIQVDFPDLFIIRNIFTAGHGD
uniref:F5/8 type C domain-containing protein n=1 Tax=Mesocestoides corti TaxID=53468 RepID=A0A5K3FNJ3_MESCO